MICKTRHSINAIIISTYTCIHVHRSILHSFTQDLASQFCFYISTVHRAEICLIRLALSSSVVSRFHLKKHFLNTIALWMMVAEVLFMNTLMAVANCETIKNNANFLCLFTMEEAWSIGRDNNWAASWENLFMPYANNKGADKPAHPRSLISTFVVRCLDSTTPLVSISKISSLYLAAAVAAKAGLSFTLLQTLKTGFLVTWLNLMWGRLDGLGYFQSLVVLLIWVIVLCLQQDWGERLFLFLKIIYTFFLFLLLSLMKWPSMTAILLTVPLKHI